MNGAIQMKTIVSASLLGVLMLASAPASQAQEWSGAYVGAQVGAGFPRTTDNQSIRFDTDLNGVSGNQVNNAAGANAFSPGFCDGVATTPNTGCRKNGSGFEFGGRAGYDWQFGSIVLGAVGEATRTRVRDSVTAFSTTPAVYTMTRELDGILAARARLGFAMGRNLPYVTGGYAKGKINRQFVTNNTANTFVSRGGGKSADGWQLGAGLDRNLTQQVTIGVEYLYTNLKDDNYRVRASGGPAGGPFTATNSSGTDFSRSQEKIKVQAARMTAAYRF